MPRNKKYVYICSPKRKVFRPGDWRDAGVVDRAALEMRCTGNCTGGSNPSLSAEIQRIKQQNPANVLFAGFCVFSPQALKSNVTQVGGGLFGVPENRLKQYTGFRVTPNGIP